MKTDALIPDTFQKARLDMVARYYAPALRIPLIVYPCVSLALGIVCYLLNLTVVGVIFSSLLGLITTAMFYFFPLFFQKVSSPVVETMLPATAGERLVFIALCCLVLNPLMVFVPKYLAEWVMRFIFAPSEFQELTDALSNMMTEGTYGLNILQGLPPLVTCMFVVLTSVRNTIGKAVGWTVATIVFLTLAGAITGVVMALSDSSSQEIAKRSGPYDIPPESIANPLRNLVVITGSFSLIYTIVMTWLAYQKMKRTQI